MGTGDLTAALVPADRDARATVITREPAVVCGRPWFDEVFRQIDPRVDIKWQADEGDFVDAGALLCRISGSARALLSGERAALNFLQTLSGTATAVRRWVEVVAGTRCRVLDTRINRIRIGVRRFQMPHSLEHPRLLRAVVKLVRGEGLAGSG